MLSSFPEDELDVRERELSLLLEEKRTSKAASAAAVTEAKKLQEAMRDQYDIFTAEDKVMEKSFRKDFADCSSAMTDQLAKLYKRRPRGKGRFKCTLLLLCCCCFGCGFISLLQN